jgi:hypothetical protein
MTFAVQAFFLRIFAMKVVTLAFEGLRAEGAEVDLAIFATLLTV